MSDDLVKAAKKVAAFEVFWIILTCIAAIIGAWSYFAWMALLCVLVPLWMTAIAALGILELTGEK